MRSLGCDEVIDYTTEDISKAEGRFDAGFDLIGGKPLEQMFEIMKPGNQDRFNSRCSGAANGDQGPRRPPGSCRRVLDYQLRYQIASSTRRYKLSISFHACERYRARRACRTHRTGKTEGHHRQNISVCENFRGSSLRRKRTRQRESRCYDELIVRLHEVARCLSAICACLDHREHAHRMSVNGTKRKCRNARVFPRLGGRPAVQSACAPQRPLTLREVGRLAVTLRRSSINAQTRTGGNRAPFYELKNDIWVRTDQPLT